MPNYVFENIKTKELKEFFFHMNDTKEVEGYIRIFVNPQTQIDTKINPDSYNDFRSKTENKKGLKIGDLWEMSENASLAREKSRGEDPIKNATIKDYEKKTKKKHPGERKVPKVIEI